MKGKAFWIKQGFWNFLEHGLTRSLDAGLSVLLIWYVSKERFSGLVLGQAWIAPLLIFFISPGWALYRNFAKWKAVGLTHLLDRLNLLRVFGWGLFLIAVGLSFGLSFVFTFHSSWSDRFFTLLWAFSLNAGPYLAGADREYLRLELMMPQVNFLTLLQKCILIGGSIISVTVWPERMEGLVAVSFLSFLVVAVLSRAMAVAHFQSLGLSLSKRQSWFPDTPVGHWVREWKEIGTGFAIPHHLCGVIFNWALSMDLFFLALVPRVTASNIASYSVALKIANFGLVIPQASGSLFTIWIGRRHSDDGRERAALFNYTLFISALTFVIFGILYWQAPSVVSVLSRGRWTEVEQRDIVAWIGWILLGVGVFAATFPLHAWITLRAQLRAALRQVYAPWGGLSALIYLATSFLGGPLWTARANPLVAAIYLSLLARFIFKVGQTA